MKTKDKVKYWLDKHPSLRDDDNRLCSNIWAEEVTVLGFGHIEAPIFEFLRLYSNNKLTSAPSIKRARAKLQEEEPKYRGEKYNLRKGILQDKWRKDLGYEKTISKLKKELDKWFSLYIRIKDSNEYGYVQCITCSVVRFYKDGMQNGHFQSRRFMATRFNEENCSTQCIKCNMYSQGEQYKFGLAIDAKYGEGTAEELEYLARTIHKVSRVEYEEQISYYKKLVENLKEEKGIE